MKVDLMRVAVLFAQDRCDTQVFDALHLVKNKQILRIVCGLLYSRLRGELVEPRGIILFRLVGGGKWPCRRLDSAVLVQRSKR